VPIINSNDDAVIEELQIIANAAMSEKALINNPFGRLKISAIMVSSKMEL